MTLLTIGVASSALFDLTESERVFREQGVAAYREHQEKRLDRPLPAGPALPFIRRLLGLNDVLADAVDVIVLSRNSAESGLRVMRSISSVGLPITRAVFREGRPAFEFMPALEMSLFLSANHDDVSEALASGHPAGTVLRGSTMPEVGRELRIAFDFDGVLADDSSERMFRQEGLGRYAQREAELADVPLSRPSGALPSRFEPSPGGGDGPVLTGSQLRTPAAHLAGDRALRSRPRTRRQQPPLLGPQGRRCLLPRRLAEGPHPGGFEPSHVLRRPAGQPRSNPAYPIGPRALRRGQRGQHRSRTTHREPAPRPSRCTGEGPRLHCLTGVAEHHSERGKRQDE